MAEPLRFHPAVADDLASATRWYDEIAIEIGNRFRRALNSKFDSIELQPQWFGRVQNEVRAARVDGFPFVVLFRCETGTTEILGVFHAAANPDKFSVRSEP